MPPVAQEGALIRRDAMTAVDSRQWGRAILLLRKYLGLQPADSKAWTRLAESCERGGDRIGALEALRMAGEAWEKDGFLPQAIAHWSKVARLSPNDGWADMKRGALCVALGRRVDAATHYRDAARSYSVSGRLQEAAQAQKLCADLASGDVEQASMASRGGGTVADEASGVRVREPGGVAVPPLEVLPSDDTEGYVADRMEHAAIMRRYGLFSIAQQSLEELLARFPDHLAARKLQIGLLKDMGEHDQATALQAGLDEELGVSGRIEPSQARYVCTSDRAPEWDSDPLLEPTLSGEMPLVSAGVDPGAPPEPGIELDWDGLLGLNPGRTQRPGSQSTRHVASFEALLSSLDPMAEAPLVDDARPARTTFVEPSSGAEASRQEAPLRPPQEGSESTRLELAAAFLQLGLYDEAIPDLEQLARSGGKAFEASVLLGKVLLDRGLPQAAIGWFDRAMAVPFQSPGDDREVRYGLGRACEAAGDVVRAFDLFLDLYTEDAGFKDVVERVQRLRPLLPP